VPSTPAIPLENIEGGPRQRRIYGCEDEKCLEGSTKSVEKNRED